jgi:hypothetical protein
MEPAEHSPRYVRIIAAVFVVFWIGSAIGAFLFADGRILFYWAILWGVCTVWRCSVWLCAAKIGRMPRGKTLWVPWCVSKSLGPNPSLNADVPDAALRVRIGPPVSWFR